MASKLVGNAVVGQSGGPTAVINQTLVGAVLWYAFKGKPDDMTEPKGLPAGRVAAA